MYGLGNSTQTKQRINDNTQSYYLKRLPNLRGSLLSCELQCGLSWSATDRSEVYTSCETSRLTLRYMPTSFYMVLRRWHWSILGSMARKSLIGWDCSRLNGGKVSDWLRLCHVTRGWCSIISLRLPKRYSTWVRWLGQWHCFPSKFRGKPTHVVNRKGRPSCCCMTLSPRSLKCPCFITKKTITMII